jgi:hypothetical protein
MFPITLHENGSRKGMSLSGFVENLARICRVHRREGRALAFVFLLFDRKHAQVHRVLDENHFYRALNEISGHWLTVFFIQTPRTVRRGEKREDPVDHDGREAIAKIQRSLDVKWDTSKPAMLFFQVEGDSLSEGHLVSFTDDSFDETFRVMRELLELAARSLANVRPEHALNSPEIFSLVRDALQDRAFKERARYTYKAIKEIKGWIPFI